MRVFMAQRVSCYIDKVPVLFQEIIGVFTDRKKAFSAAEAVVERDGKTPECVAPPLFIPKLATWMYHVGDVTAEVSIHVCEIDVDRGSRIGTLTGLGYDMSLENEEFADDEAGT